jgi:hypothetical protein
MAVVAFGWTLDRGQALAALARFDGDPLAHFLHIWIRFVLPSGILLVFIWWLLSDVLKVVGTTV